MNCPKCATPMLLEEKKGIEIDYCPECRGVWLDKGELQRIIALVGEHYSDKRNYEMDFQNYDYGDKDYYIHHPNRCKKSYLSNFFDI